MKLSEIFYNGLIKENPVLVQLIGMCSVLAVTTTAVNGLAMGLSVIFVLVGSNIVVSLIRNVIPDEVRIPSYIVVVATFVTIIEMFLKAYAQDIYNALGLFIPLIVVNCIILARAEAFASKNGIIPSIVDGLGMGLGYTLALIVLGSLREILGAGTIFGYQLFSDAFQPALILIMPPGAFLLLGILIAIFNKVRANKEASDAEAKGEA